MVDVLKEKILSAKRNDRPCICGYDKKVKKCCLEMIKGYKRGDLSGNETIKTFITYDDLWSLRQNTKSDVINILSRYDPLDAIQTLAKINCILHREDTNAASLVVLSEGLPKSYLNKIRLWIFTQQRSVVFPRQSILVAAQIVMATQNLGEHKILVEDDKEAFFDCLLRLSSHISTSQNAKQQADPMVVRNAQAEFIPNAHFNQNYKYTSVLARMHLIYTQGVNEVKQKYSSENLIDIDKKFEEIFHFSILECLVLGFSVWTYYGSRELKQLYQKPENFIIADGFFKNLVNEELRLRTKNFFKLFCASVQEYGNLFANINARYTDNSYTLIPFYDKPLVDTGNETYFLLDLQFFEHRMANGLVWLLNDKLDKKESHSLLQLFGRSTEWYVKEILNELPQSENNNIYSEWEGQIDGCDFVYNEEGYIFAIEVKSRFLPIQKIISGKPEDIEKSIHYKWFAEGGHDRGDINQLSKFVTKIHEEGLVVNGEVVLQSTQIKKVWPIIVYFDSIPLHPAVWKWLDDIMLAKGVPEEFIDSISILNIEELETYCSLIQNGHSLHKLFLQRRTDYNKWKTSPKNLLYEQYKDIHDSTLLKNSSDQLFAKAKLTLFNRE